MTGKERISNILQHKPVDRIGLYEHFWGDTLKTWKAQGHIPEGESLSNHFNLDLDECWAFNMMVDIDFVPEVVEETEDTIMTRDGNGALLRRQKDHDATPEHVDFAVRDSATWNELAKPRLKVDERRINFEYYRNVKADAAKHNRFFCWSGVNVFELMHPLCGHEYLLMGMGLEPEWVEEMAETYADMTIELMKILFEKEGLPDGIWFYEDMGFKERPFMSPDMYRKLIFPSHKKTCDFAHSLGLPVIMHSCGFIEPLLPDMIKAGIDCLQVIEIKAGMNLQRIHEQFGDQIALMGGIDVRTLYSNDKEVIEKELKEKIPVVKNGFGYVLHSDHSVPCTVDYEIYKFFIQRGLELGTY